MPATLGHRKVLKMEVTTGVLSPGPRRYFWKWYKFRWFWSKSDICHQRSLPLTKYGIYFPRSRACLRHCLQWWARISTVTGPISSIFFAICDVLLLFICNIMSNIWISTQEHCKSLTIFYADHHHYSVSLQRGFLHEEAQISGLVYYVRLVMVFIRLYSSQNMSIPVVY
jgi:hypothetical protein